MTKKRQKWGFTKKPVALGDKTAYGPRGYVVYSVLTDSASDQYESIIAEFKHRTHAELFIRTLRKEQREKDEQEPIFYEEVKR